MTKVLSQSRKWGLALLGVALQAVSAGVLPEKYQPWGAVVVALATALGVYHVPNAAAPGMQSE